jgi:hypothetical protein
MVERKTMSVPDAGKLYYDLSRNASYDAARRGDIRQSGWGGCCVFP